MEDILHQVINVVYFIIYRVLNKMPEFLPSVITLNPAPPKEEFPERFPHTKFVDEWDTL